MYVSLFGLGLVLTVAGAVAVVFGIPIHEFGLGNTLIIAGTTAFVGGLILIGLAEAGRQLRRIAESLMARPSPRVPRPGEAFESTMPAPGRIPFPPKPGTDAHRRGATAFEQRLAAAPSLDTADEGFERPAPAFSPGAEPQATPERDEAPLSPQAPAPGRREPHFIFSRNTMEYRDEEMRAGPQAKEELPISELDSNLRPGPFGERSRQGGAFESLWPAEPMRGSVSTRESEPEAAEEEEQEREETMAEPHAVSILKSGVVDGMAYTLYSDGSIEAEMPQGTVRFASIDELRAYLEESS
jgi:hypothetical protein